MSINSEPRDVKMGMKASHLSRFKKLGRGAVSCGLISGANVAPPKPFKSLRLNTAKGAEGVADVVKLISISANGRFKNSISKDVRMELVSRRARSLAAARRSLGKDERKANANEIPEKVASSPKHQALSLDVG